MTFIQRRWFTPRPKSPHGHSSAVATPPSSRQRTSEGQAFGLQGFAPFIFGCGLSRTTLSCHGLTVVAHVRSPVRGSTRECVRSTPFGPWVNGLLCGPSWTRCPQAQHTVPHARATQASCTPLHKRDWCPVSLVIPTRCGVWDGQKHLPKFWHHVLFFVFCLIHFLLCFCSAVL
jgi:hypothetical protein